MDQLGSTYPHYQRLPSIIITTSSGALEGAAHSQQSLRRLVRRRTQLPWAQIRAGRVRWRAGRTISLFQGEAGALGRRGRWDGKGETVGSDQDGYGDEAAFTDAASGKGGAEVEQAIAMTFPRIRAPYTSSSFCICCFCCLPIHYVALKS